MPRTTLTTLMLLFLVLAAGAVRFASAQTEKKTARKFDEFGDIDSSYLKAILDNFAIQLENEPTAKGFIVVYRSRRDLPGLSHSLALGMKNYLVASRRLPKDRIVTVDGGVAMCLTRELWIVPIGSTPPPRSDARIGYFHYSDAPWKFFEYGFLPPEYYKRFAVPKDEDSDPEYLEAYANEVKNKRTNIACVIVYAQYNSHPGLADYSGNYEPSREVRLDPPGVARRRLELEKRYLTGVYGIPASRIRTIDGGYRKHRGVELWIVPAGEPTPIPTPNSFPKERMK
ncbi:MAG: hypothetical protein M3R52_13290 [Acidobacteriota bacterium]|nr:hypothetical protein [Acidobacteriota bacterium]